MNIEILDPENLLLDMFPLFLCQLQTAEIITILATILVYDRHFEFGAKIQVKI